MKDYIRGRVKKKGLSAKFVVRASRLPPDTTTYWAAGTAAPQSSTDLVDEPKKDKV